MDREAMQFLIAFPESSSCVRQTCVAGPSSSLMSWLTGPHLSHAGAVAWLTQSEVKIPAPHCKPGGLASPPNLIPNNKHLPPFHAPMPLASLHFFFFFREKDRW